MLYISVYTLGNWNQSFMVDRRSGIPSGSFPSPKGYMFPLRIPEQLTMSTAHFHQFLNLVNDWNFTGVEPFAYGSTLFGLRSIPYSWLLWPWNPRDFMLFSEMFDVSAHNRYMSECLKRAPDPETGYPVLFEPLGEFLLRSYRKIVLVYFAAHGESPLPTNIRTNVEKEINTVRDVFTDCSVASKKHGMFNHVEHLLSEEVNLERLYPSSTDANHISLPYYLPRFEVVQAFCVKQSIKISLRDLRDFILSRIHRADDTESSSPQVSIIFVSWQGRFTHPLVESDVKDYINTCRIPFSSPFHNNFVKNTAERYRQSQLRSPRDPYLSVHVRFEKLFYYAAQQKKEMDEYLNCCMRRLNSLLSLLTIKFNISEGNILLNWDYSPYGSKTCPRWDCTGLANRHLKTVTVKPSYFEPAKFKAPSHNAMISLVEMHALYGGKALVTVGEGSYQHTIVRTFVSQHRDPKNPEELHYGHLCIPQEDLHGLSSLLGPEC